MRWLLQGTLAVANPGLLLATSHILSLEHLGSNGPNPQRVGGSQASDNGRPGALPRGGRLRGPNRVGNLATPGSPGRACKDYPESQISKENFTVIQRAISQLVDKLPEEGLNPRLVDSY